MSPEAEPVQGNRYATVLSVENISIAGKTTHRVIYRYTNDHMLPAKETLIRPEQTFRGIRQGMLVRVHFCFSRVLRIERVG